MYYVLDGAVYQAPTLHAVFSARLVRAPSHPALALARLADVARVSQLRCAFNLRGAFNALQERLGSAAEALAEPPAAPAADEPAAPAATAPAPAPTAAASSALAATASSGEADEQRRLAMFAMGALRTFDATPAGAQVRATVTARAQAAAGAAAPQAETPAAVAAN